MSIRETIKKPSGGCLRVFTKVVRLAAEDRFGQQQHDTERHRDGCPSHPFQNDFNDRAFRDCGIVGYQVCECFILSGQVFDDSAGISSFACEAFYLIGWHFTLPGDNVQLLNLFDWKVARPL
jgi:hypothetical protein